MFAFVHKYVNALILPSLLLGTINTKLAVLVKTEISKHPPSKKDLAVTTLREKKIILGF